jgi:4a-hydroxytetrahydrobiopterin dehydratase
MTSADDLRQQQCAPRQTALSADEVVSYLQAIDGWSLNGGKIVKTFAFRDYHATLAFVNAIGEMIHSQDHHPELLVSYNRCVVSYNTHSVNEGRGGLSQIDFICAARIDDIFNRSFT